MIDIINGAVLEEQSEEFKVFFSENIQPSINFSEGFDETDSFNRPKKWLIADVIIQAEYYSESENYDFNTFTIWR
jgi:hypothetical protein